MAKETKVSARKLSASHWRMQKIVQESMDSSDDEFFDARDVPEGKSAILLGMSQWNSNDLVEQIESLGHMDPSQDALYRLGRPRCAPQGSIDGLEDLEKKCKTHVLLLVIHGGNILDTAGSSLGSKAGDTGTLAGVLERVARAHFQAAADHVTVRLVAGPAACAEAFSLVSHLNPYSYDESCVSSSVDHLPLAALPLLAIASPRYQDAVATIIARANQIYQAFLQSEEGQGFSGQVCLMADCVGGVLCFDALCFSSQRHGSPSDVSRNNSMESLKDEPPARGEPSCSLSASKRLSKSNIDISAPGSRAPPKKPLTRKQSDSYNRGDSSTFFSSLVQEDAPPRPGSNSSLLSPGHFDFPVSDCFLLGCPLGLVLAMRRTVLPAIQVTQLRPACSQIYNLFYPSDPSASRLEPLLSPRFHRLPPFAVPRYQRYPLGDGRCTLIADTIHSHPEMFSEDGPGPGGEDSGGGPRRGSLTSVGSEASACSSDRLNSTIANISSTWWGTKRLDYALYCPDVLTSFPTVALPHLFHASYWESTDVVAFVLRQVMRCDCLKAQEADCFDSAPFSPSSPREKWLRRRTHVKLRNVTSNHRVNDVIATEDGPQILVGRFMYGPLDMVTLTGEKVDVLLMTQPQSGRWVHFDTEVTSSSGRVTYTIPKEKKLGVGVYPIRMVVKGDQTCAEAFLTVLPRGMECVVFSIDGSFAASVSIMGSDPKVRPGAVDVVRCVFLSLCGHYPKVRPGAVDVVRHWQDLGYLILYITGRPDMQKQRVVSWLSQHNFPQGAVFFSEGLVHDPLRQKALFLRNLMQECHIKISAAYGSMKDISVYSMLGLSPSQIYIVGRPSKKCQNQCQFLSEGYAAHLSMLQFGHRTRPKKSSSVRMVLRKGSFGLSAKPEFLCKRTHLRRTMSVQQPDPPCSANPKPERAQSQPESDKDLGGGSGGGVSLSVWGRGSLHREDTTP
ncbi:membrane-associated phosphatidylinositol transfer protein 3 isoform X4 [Paramormyrops kingsleyae]|uniref:membrane-associated phosphatidylinositol transfer protein 3 isoform X4 n=1 Tax=Paramormyrops kingsleyae TaxID=1676925 RepID=UPI003B974999